jgi:cell wall-associated NlpC family hydrolase
MRQSSFCFIVVIMCFLSACSQVPLQTAQQTTTIKQSDPRAQIIIDQASKLIGTPYKFGGKEPHTGMDCSGLVAHVYQSVGITLPRNAAEIGKIGKEISREALQPGDLVFFKTRQHRLSHVGIYIGDGHFLHAPSEGATVKTTRLDNPYFAKRFTMARTYLASR